MNWSDEEGPDIALFLLALRCALRRLFTILCVLRAHHLFILVLVSRCRLIFFTHHFLFLERPVQVHVLPNLAQPRVFKTFIRHPEEALLKPEQASSVASQV